MNVPSRKTGNRITKIAPKKDGKIALFLGEKKLTISENVFTEMPLYMGKTLSLDEKKTLFSLIHSDALYHYGLSLASKGSYSAKMVREKLIKKAKPGQDVSSVLARLKAEGFLDDATYAEEFKEEKEAQNYGPARIKEDLLSRGIKPDLIDKLQFSQVEAHAKAYSQLLEKRYHSLPLNEKKRKAAASICRRGYSSSLAREVVSSFHYEAISERKNLAKQAESLIKRYSQKYNGYELREKCFVSLLRHGYKAEDISRLLEELGL